VPVSSDAGTATVAGAGNVGAGLPVARTEFDPSLDSPQEDIATGSSRGQVSVAILTVKGEAFAFANESYAHEPSPGQARVEATYGYLPDSRASTSVEQDRADEYKQAFKLEYFSNDFSKFQLLPAT
jgi:hypothetical protein